VYLSNAEVLFMIIAFHLLSSLATGYFSDRTLARAYTILRTRDFEDQGMFYQRCFHIRKWKDYVPSFGAFEKKHLTKEVSNEYSCRFILETVRAEATHHLCIISTILILLISKPDNAIGFYLFFLLINLPCILIQRYNRPRLEHLLELRGEVFYFNEDEERFFIRNPRRR